ncbi:Stk1 family PASTA domain-containing Ser/Thr kinase [Paenibacillus flagellatus]|uniref:Serine/threonine-protein kinase PrkC n=1 Tax=Paenibacillus flagellatus TaxID=2211139 RepID=A0A2V5K4T4_9BACL|nr:Stk1 family PASTA domain-containing Ser/Thr kinase [Paenibacillus flagellatus]PYI54345.1 Stk1 family PASTA domain-containing Ser/Thr kinase [Paenibacillus flagellatus]
MIGQVLGGRYEILERIGGGGMALVYKGHDILLNRKVAVKVLRQQYVHDEEFIRRFRREAQAAASLSHPNVVSIYDVGQEDETHYIVMEYVENKTLNDLIKERAPLPVEESIRIASQICDALDHAHHNQIIHRDIKPHNILIGKNGRVKVTDFGIARAADSTQLTQTGSVVGSVHYFSPEHAKGTLTGAQSDLYSLGIVLYQMLTGRLPFLGESPISVALKHLQEDFEEPRKVNPLIPQSVENLIMKSMRKNPQERYQSAKEMLLDLDTCLTPDRRNESKIVFASDDYDDNEKTRVVPAIRGDQYAQPVQDDGRAGAGGRKRKAWVKPVVWTVVTLLLLFLMYLGVRYVKSMVEVPETDVPNLVGKTVQEAEKALADAQLQSKIVTETNEQVAKDIVIRQDPEPIRLKINNTVTLYVSLGPEKKKMPDWKGKKPADVKAELATLGIAETQLKQEQVFAEEEAGTVVAQTPAAGEEYDPKTVAIKLSVSKGREQVSMPELIGKTQAEAEALAKRFDLKVVTEQAPTFKQPKGKVFDQFPFKPNDPVTPGAEVKIFVSSGYPANAKEVTVSKVLSPAEKGKESTIKIVYSDARGDNIEWGSPRKITDTQTFDVQLVLSPDKDGSVAYYRDGNRVDIDTVPYAGKTTTNPGTGGGTTAPGGGTQQPGGQKPGTGTGTGTSTGTSTGGTTGDTKANTGTGGAQTTSGSSGGSNTSTGGRN